MHSSFIKSSFSIKVEPESVCYIVASGAKLFLTDISIASKLKLRFKGCILPLEAVCSIIIRSATAFKHVHSSSECWNNMAVWLK